MFNHQVHILFTFTESMIAAHITKFQETGTEYMMIKTFPDLVGSELGVVCFKVYLFGCS